MFTPRQDGLLRAKMPHLPTVVMEGDLRRDIDDLLAAALPGLKLAVVDDVQTHIAMGEQVGKALHRQRMQHITLNLPLDADDTSVEYVRERTKSCDALVAVGSGTVSDIVKYASALDKKPYVVFPTAASMNGYLSANASIRIKGYKKTVKAHIPIGVYCDLGIIAAAPARLSKSGLGDSLARSTAQADWLLSHHLLGTHYDATPFDLLADIEPQLFDSARGITLQDRDSIALLMQVMMLSGLGMTIAGGSYPASQAEHMIAHTVGMLGKAEHSTLHGEEIGVTTLFVADLQERMLRKKPQIKTDQFDDAKMTKLFGVYAAEEAKKAFQIKDGLTQASINHWGKAAEAIANIFIPPTRIVSILEKAEAPTQISQLGWSDELFKTAVQYSRFLRDRFTCLDLVLSSTN